MYSEVVRRLGYSSLDHAEEILRKKARSNRIARDDLPSFHT